MDRPPQLFIGFTRQWPTLLQAVMSYIAAGWPANGIYAVENTGVHNSNRDGKLSLQNPFYLNHTTLKRFGVNVVQTPTLLSFAQMQNFFMSLAYQFETPHYFYSHQDVVVFSFETGPDNTTRPGDRPWQFLRRRGSADGHEPARRPAARIPYDLRELPRGSCSPPTSGRAVGLPLVPVRPPSRSSTGPRSKPSAAGICHDPVLPPPTAT